MTPAAVYGLAASALIIGAAATLLPWRHRRGLGAVVALVTLPTLAPWLHGILGAPSFTLCQLALLRLLAPERAPFAGRGPALALAAFAAVFYPLALGLGPVDPFALGYRPLPLLAALVPLGLWLARRRQAAWLILIGGDLAAYALGLFDNLWNACFDPLLVGLAVVRLVRRSQRDTASTMS